MRIPAHLCQGRESGFTCCCLHCFLCDQAKADPQHAARFASSGAQCFEGLYPNIQCQCAWLAESYKLLEPFLLLVISCGNQRICHRSAKLKRILLCQARPKNLTRWMCTGKYDMSFVTERTNTAFAAVSTMKVIQTAYVPSCKLRAFPPRRPETTLIKHHNTAR